MGIQIFGTPSCKETRKAERFFKERGVPFKSIEITRKMISAGEMSVIIRRIDPSDLIDTQSKRYVREGYSYREFDPIEEIFEHPDLLRTPIVRDGQVVVLGADPDALKVFLEQSR